MHKYDFVTDAERTKNPLLKLSVLRGTPNLVLLELVRRRGAVGVLGERKESSGQLSCLSS